MHTHEAPTISVPSNETPASDGDPTWVKPNAPANAPTFPPDAVLANRYRVVRYIAKGGMGEVYEAEDLTLKGRVALKTILPDIAKNEVSLERFRREIAIARRVTHPNVSRIYDIGTHGETMFLTMEFLAGEDLRRRVVKRGKLTEQEALPIVEQIAAGLHAAHEVGIIHRDFKSANVMLVPGQSGKSERAVVTDFGLARPQATEEGLETLSESGAVVGTPAYMAPEQVEGLDLTAAADIYALGITIYEMLTGKRPFEGSSAFSTAVKRLTEAPSPPRVHVPEISDTWEAVILRCLARDPSERFADVYDVAKALRGDETPTMIFSGPGIAGTPKNRIGSVPAIAAVVVLLGVLSVFAVRFLITGANVREADPTAAEQQARVSLRNSVAVLGLRNNSGLEEVDWLSAAITEMLATELAAAGNVRVAPGQEVTRMKGDLGLAQPDNIDTEVLGKVRDQLGVGSVVMGSYTMIGDAGSRLLRLDLKLVDTSTGEILGTSGTSGTEVQLFDLVSRVGGGLRKGLGLGELSPSEVVAVQAALPSGAEAVRLYTDGISKLRQLDVAGARDRLLEAAKADPEHPLTYSALSSAYSALGEEALASETAARAVALGNKLGREQQLQVEMRLHEAAKDWPKAIESGTTLWQSFPDNIDYGLDLANAQISGGATNEALVTIQSLRQLPLPLSADGRIDLTESRAYQEMGDFEKQKTLARAAANKGEKVGARLLTARARLLEATADLTLGDLDNASAAAEQARALFDVVGDRSGVARAIELAATPLDFQGDMAGERRLLEQALEIHREIGDRVSSARVMQNIGRVVLYQGNAEEAEKYFAESLATFKAAGAKFPLAISLNAVGAMMFYLGDLDAAAEHYTEALSLFSELGEKTGTAATLTNFGEVLACRGELEKARQMHEDSLAINRAIGDKGGAAYDLFRIGEIFAHQGNLVTAKDRFEAALKLQNEIGDRLGAAESQTALADLKIDSGEAEQAAKDARGAEEVLRTEGAVEPGYKALAVVVNALLVQGKVEEARGLAHQLQPVTLGIQDRRVRHYVAAAVARAQAASGTPDDRRKAMRFLETVLTDSGRSRFTGPELESRLAEAEIAAAAGIDEGRRNLAAVANDAKARGFARIASRATLSDT